MNIPKTRMTYCKGKECRKHTQHKVTQYKAGKVCLHERADEQLERSFPTNQYSILNHSTTGLAVRAGKETLRPKAVRLRWSDQACLPQEG